MLKVKTVLLFSIYAQWLLLRIHYYISGSVDDCVCSSVTDWDLGF